RIGGRAGTYGELVAADPAWLAPLGDDVDFVTGATLPLNALTARHCIDLLAAEPGATILITGASGAVGSYAVQLAVRDGYRVIALSGRDDEDWPRELGAHEVVFTRSPGDGEPERGITFKPMLVDTDPAALRSLADDLAAGRLKPSRVAETLDLAEAA